jgi:hypothetical protein
MRLCYSGRAEKAIVRERLLKISTECDKINALELSDTGALDQKIAH